MKSTTWFRSARISRRGVVAGSVLALAGLAVSGIGSDVLAVGAASSTVTVTAGKPSEYVFRVVPAKGIKWGRTAPDNTVVFKVKNAGKVAHSFKVCATPGRVTRTTCKGTTTPVLRPGMSATLKVKLASAGTFAYLSGVPGQAAKGMKGLITVVAVPATTTKVTTTVKTTTQATTSVTTPTTTGSTTPPTTTTASGSGGSGSTAAGSGVFAAAGCGNCHTLGELKQQVGNITSTFNTSHSTPFDGGALSQGQIADLVAFINASK